MKFMNMALIGVFLVFIIFNGLMIYTYWKFGSVPDTLILSVNGGLIGECGFAAIIKTAKEKMQNRKWEIEDRKQVNNIDNKETNLTDLSDISNISKDFNNLNLD